MHSKLQQSAQAASEGTTVSFNARTKSAYAVIQGTIDRLEALDALDGIDTAARPYNPFARSRGGVKVE